MCDAGTKKCMVGLHIRQILFVLLLEYLWSTEYWEILFLFDINCLYLANTICYTSSISSINRVLGNVTAPMICIWLIPFVFVIGRYHLQYFPVYFNQLSIDIDYLYLANTICYTSSVSSINRVLRNITAREKAGRKERQTRFHHHHDNFHDDNDHHCLHHHNHHHCHHREFLSTEPTGRAGRGKKKERKRKPAAGVF